MSENSKKISQIIDQFATETLLQENLETIFGDRFGRYSKYIIQDRALPDVRDGLKPVQRRILFALYKLKMFSDKPYKKSARLVGEVIGKYHPHGDTSVYDAMVRLAQNFNMRACLVDGHGNFGSIDGDDAAAMRYTEARMAPLALEILRDLEKDTVSWMLNFDDSLKEPVTLPCRFPNILVNGASGIAVGLATNIPTHNLGEVIDGAVAYIDNPYITLKEMMKKIKGPDFPTGGYLIAGDELEKAYETGKGKVTLRAKVHIETGDNDKKNIVIDELPYQVNKAALLQRVLELRDAKKDELAGISEIADESDRQGMRAVIKVKKDYDATRILNILFKNTQLEMSYGINMVAIADGRPQQMGLLDILAYYTDYQRTIILKRTKFDLEAAKERAHILEGLLVAVKNIDEVVKIIKTSANTTEAKTNLRLRFELSEKQAQAILDLRLAKLTSLEVYKLETELAELKKLIARLTEILGSKKLQFEIVKEEMLEIKKKYKDPRRTVIINSIDEYDIPASDTSVPVEDCFVTTSENGLIKRMSAKYFANATKGFGERSNKNEMFNNILRTQTDKQILVFSNAGNAYKINVFELPDAKWKDKGANFSDVTSAQKNERPVYVMEITDPIKDGNLMMFTKQGMIKKTKTSEYNLLKSAYQAIKLKDDDELLKVEEERPNNNIAIVTKQGMILNALSNDVPEQGRVSGGVKGISLNDGDAVILIGQVTKEDNIIAITNKAYAKKVNICEVDETARYRKGVKLYDLKPTSTGTELVGAFIEKGACEVIVESESGEFSAISNNIIPEDTRGSKGKKLSVEGITLTSAVYRLLEEN